jgi:hypothetical protein
MLNDGINASDIANNVLSEFDDLGKEKKENIVNSLID